MNREKAFQMEQELLAECEKYIDEGPETKEEILELCVKAFKAVQAYRKALEKSPQGRHPSGQ